MFNAPMKISTPLSLVALIASLAACQRPAGVPASALDTVATSDKNIRPVITTDTVKHDSDDPAIWINAADPTQSLIVGTDKDEDGALYVFNLQGKMVNVIRDLKRPNNVDIEYGLLIDGKPVDVAVVTERLTHKLRIFSLPDLRPLDHGGLPMFEGETETDYRDLMGIALYKQPATDEVYAVVGRKTGPATGYLWQYKLEDDKQGGVKATVVRKFGAYSGHKEIESIAVDDVLGYIYYSDEGVGIRKYYADPRQGDEELALFGTHDFIQDHEGISIYHLADGKGYILVSDQQANTFNVYPREGSAGNPHLHERIAVLPVSTVESDGSDVTSVSLPGFKTGLFVAMSTDKTFQLYRWEDLAPRLMSVPQP